MKKYVLVLSLMLIALSGCYMRAYDEGHRRDSERHEGEGRGQDERKGDHGEEHRER